MPPERLSDRLGAIETAKADRKEKREKEKGSLQERAEAVKTKIVEAQKAAAEARTVLDQSKEMLKQGGLLDQEKAEIFKIRKEAEQKFVEFRSLEREFSAIQKAIDRVEREEALASESREPITPQQLELKQKGFEDLVKYDVQEMVAHIDSWNLPKQEKEELYFKAVIELISTGKIDKALELEKSFGENSPRFRDALEDGVAKFFLSRTSTSTYNKRNEFGEKFQQVESNFSHVKTGEISELIEQRGLRDSLKFRDALKFCYEQHKSQTGEIEKTERFVRQQYGKDGRRSETDKSVFEGLSNLEEMMKKLL